MLTKCPECKREVSSEANSCPHCGFLHCQLDEGTSRSLRLVRGYTKPTFTDGYSPNNVSGYSKPHGLAKASQHDPTIPEYYRAYCSYCGKEVKALERLETQTRGGVFIDTPGPGGVILPLQQIKRIHVCPHCNSRVMTASDIAISDQEYERFEFGFNCLLIVLAICGIAVVVLVIWAMNAK